MNFVAIDFETANEMRDSACAIGVAVVKNGRVTDSSAWLIHPPTLSFSSINVGIHGITADDVVGEPRFDQVWRDMSPVLLGAPLVAHNASFDFSVLRSVLDIYSISYPNVEYYCTYLLAKRVWPSLANHKLPTVADHLNIRFQHHDASADATTCARIAIALCKILRVDNLAAAAAAVGLDAKRLSTHRVVKSVTLGNSTNVIPAPLVTRRSEGSTMSEIGEVTCTYTARGLAKYSVLVSHEELVRFQEIKSDDPHVLLQKAQAKVAQWDEMWRRQEEAARRRIDKLNQVAEIEEKLAFATEQTTQAQQERERLGNVLAYTLDVDDMIDWESLKGTGNYPEPKPRKPNLPTPPARPVIPPQPRSTDPAYMPRFGLLDTIFASRRKKKIDIEAKKFSSDCKAWKAKKKEAIEKYNGRASEYNATVSRLQEKFTNDTTHWEKARAVFLQDQAKSNAAIGKKKEMYLSGAPEAILDYCDMVLTRSQYPECFPQSCELDYRSESTLLVVNYQLPAPSDLPTLKEVKYVRSRDEYSEKHISESQRNKLYDSVLYQVALRTIHELFEADQVDAFESVVFNGIVKSLDPSTGKETTSCVLSVQADRKEFLDIDLAQVAPKACFRKLKGVGSSKLHSIAAVAPIVTMDKEDSRFVESFDVAQTLDDSTNLAAMDWEEFEHLIRQLFENHFAAGGGEVKVTHASRDGGVDAVAFDPDPIRGGKIVIQAKRYTNTVGVGAVRDLYGTLMNEGANKGILVTTSHYGPDAYGFAKGKPITLLDGGNLLHLLQSHGYKAKIDIREARSETAG